MSVLVVAAVVASCGEKGVGTENSPSGTLASEQSSPSGSLVGGRRPITDAELRRLDGGEENHVLDCENEGAFVWDYGPIEDDPQSGRQPEDALVDALSEINGDLEEEGWPPLPEAGWIGLTDDRTDGVHFVLVGGDGGWRAVVSVGGEVDRGVWQHNEAIVCEPE